jgi:hypothetical protein
MMNRARAVPPSRRAGATLVLATAVLVAACSAAAQPTPATPPGGATPAPSPTAASPTSGRPSDLPIPTPAFATVDPSARPIVGEAPPALVAAARADLAGRVAAADAETAEVVRAEAVQWPDGSLGCRVPGELYPQVITPGYWIVLSVDGKEYDYRATEAGTIRLCDQTLKPNPGG